MVDNPAKIQGLKDFITYTEEKGAQVDGIATELALNVGADKSKIETMLQGLAGTGKLIKISALDIGTGGTTGEATAALYQQQAEMYKWFVKAYYNAIRAAHRGVLLSEALMIEFQETAGVKMSLSDYGQMLQPVVLLMQVINENLRTLGW